MVVLESNNRNASNRLAELLKTALPPTPGFVAVLVLCQLRVIHALLNIQTFQLPLPSEIVDSFGRRGRDLWIGTWYTVGEAVSGLALGAGLGFVTAGLFVRFDFLRRGLMPLAASANAIPIVASPPLVSRRPGFEPPNP